ncbi:MAG: saccharopine dehydrogenase NADP-binding domain-containing protein [Candidatus Limnocylindrus sp.]
MAGPGTLLVPASTPRPARIVVLGCGSIGQAVVPLLIRDLGITPSSIRVVELLDTRARIADSIAKGVTYEQAAVTRENLGAFLGERLGAGDVLLDLAWNIDAIEIIDWCRNHGVRYLNTSVEVWEPYADVAEQPPATRTLYHRHMGLRAMITRWGNNNGPSAIVEHGANPGWVSHEAKFALEELGAALLSRNAIVGADAAARIATLERALAADDFAQVAEAAGVKVIQISERDTQLTDRPKEVGEFVNTWSGEGFYEEGIAPAELGWGTHERALPARGLAHAGDGPRNQILIRRAGMETQVRTWIPGATPARAIAEGGESIGMLIRHGEAFTMSDHLTVRDERGAARYRPTVYYAYCPSDAAIASVHELRGRNWAHPERFRLLNNEITTGEDRLGVFLLGHPLKGWWSGSLLSIDEARVNLPGHSATTLQVAGSVIAAVAWLLRHPNEGLRVPDELPHRELLNDIRHYLGTRWSGAVDWTPLAGRLELFPDAVSPAEAPGDDPWQFSAFLAR